MGNESQLIKNSMIVMITNTIPPYCYDIAYVLGLPANFSHRFRYHAKWMRLSCNVSDIKRQPALIVLRNEVTAGLTPVRYAQIEDVLPVGDINYIEFRLQCYFPVARIDSASTYLNNALETKGFVNKQGADLDCLVLEVDSGDLGDAGKEEKLNSHQMWSNLLGVIGQFNCYKDFSFLKVLHVRDSKGDNASAVPDETGKYSFALKPSHVYYLDLIQHIPWEMDKTESIETPYDVELKSETAEVAILRKIQRVVGKYDLLRFIFKTAPGESTKHTFVEVESKQGGELAKYGLPTLFLPLRIEAPQWMKAVVWIRRSLSVLAVVVIVVSNPLARWLGAEAEWVRDLALLLLVLSTGKWEEAMLAFLKETTKEARLA